MFNPSLDPSSDGLRPRTPSLTSKDNRWEDQKLLRIGPPLPRHLHLVGQKINKKSPDLPLWWTVHGVSICRDTVIEHAHRLVVLHTSMQVATVVSVYAIVVHFLGAPVRLVLRLPLQVS